MRPWLVVSTLALVACGRETPSPPTPVAAASVAPSVAPWVAPSVAPSVAGPVGSAVGPVGSAVAPVEAPQMAVATAPTAATPPAAPAVDVRSIGMHIGGGPNDDATKAPFLAAIAGAHPDVAGCWATLGKRVAVDFGVDLLVPAKGGLAKVDRPRSTVPDPGFVKCATAAFARVPFAPTKSGLPTKVSTSVRLSPR